MRERASGLLLPLLMVPLLGGCDDGQGPDRRYTLHVVPGGPLSDTIGAAPPAPLTVEARNDGAPAAGVEVTFTSPDADRLLLGAAGSGGAFSTSHTGSTDAAGRAAAALRPGSKAGPVTVSVASPSAAGTTLVFEVLPGAAVEVRVLPADTAVTVGERFAARAVGFDRAGNATAATGPLQSLDPSVVRQDGDALLAAAAGRGRVVGLLGAHEDTAAVSVVPEGRLVAVDSVEGWIAQLRTDGEEVTLLTSLGTGPGASDAHPTWNPATGWVAYERPADGSRTLWAADVNGDRGRLLEPGVAAYGAWPRYDDAGEHLYFAGRADPGASARVWRTGATGGVALPLGPATPEPGLAAPDPEPDGRHIAYGDTAGLALLDTTTNTVARLGTGRLPRWSPAGDRIAFVHEGALMLVRPDGSERAVLSSDEWSFSAATLDWSPDGDWLVARSDHTSTLVLVRVSTGAVLPLPYAAGLTQAVFATLPPLP